MIDKRDESIDENLEQAMIFDANVLYHFIRNDDKEMKAKERAIFKSAALHERTIYAQNHIDGYYHVFSYRMLNLILSYFLDAWGIESYDDYLYSSRKFPTLSWHFSCYSNVDKY